MDPIKKNENSSKKTPLTKIKLNPLETKTQIFLKKQTLFPKKQSLKKNKPCEKKLAKKTKPFAKKTSAPCKKKKDLQRKHAKEKQKKTTF